MDRIYTIYKHTNKINGKVYIGQTNQEPSRRWKNGNGYRNQDYFWNAIQKYSWGGFEHEILFSNLTHDEADMKEKELISFYKSNDRQYGYNIANGGNSIGKHSEETKIKIKKASTGRKHTEETKEKMSKAKKGKESSFKGKKHTEEAKRKSSESHKGRKNSYLVERNKVFNARATSIVQLDSDGKLINEFKSIRDASSKTNINRLCIANVCKGKQNHAGGFKWMYYQDWRFFNG